MKGLASYLEDLHALRNATLPIRDIAIQFCQSFSVWAFIGMYPLISWCMRFNLPLHMYQRKVTTVVIKSHWGLEKSTMG
jgi:hypothetical protein